ncbi:hypothetical protein BKI52_41920 [marine bacterium AO1-C]|nr:hypothetical protein BKI52_41920 [marine bacterium AO1-C]
MKHLIFALLMMNTTLISAQSLKSFNDEFDSNLLNHWKSFHESEGWPNFVKKVDVNITTPGSFYLEPQVGFWYGEVHAGPYYFKELPKGDFTVITRIKVEGRNTLSPVQSFSLAGLMIRAPRPIEVEKTAKGHENWLFTSTGYAKGKKEPQFETKVTVNGKSRLKIYPAQSGWVELGISRVGTTFKMAYKKDGRWITVRTVENTNMGAELQVGFIAYTDFNGKMKRRYVFGRKKLNTTVYQDGTPDVKASFDYIRFYSPKEMPFEVAN